MKISVITITYNAEAFLAEAMASVIGQGYDDLEYILVDGGSTDGTLDIIRSHAARHPCIRWVSGPDAGIADAMNKGIGLATGEVIAHLHADDAYLPGTLCEVARLFTLDPAARWVTGRLRCVDGAGRRLYDTELKKGYTLRHLLHANIISHPATFVRRRVFNEVGLFDTTLRYAMDYDLWLRIVALEPPVVSDRVMAMFRVHPGSLSSMQLLAAMAEEQTIRQRYWHVLAPGERCAAELRYRRETLLIRLGLNNLRKRFMQKLQARLHSASR